MKRGFMQALLALLWAVEPLGAWASITYTLTPLGGSTYQYAYVVHNDTAGPISEFSIFFDHARYANLQLTGAPAGWDALVIQPETGLPSSGFVDLLSLASGLGVGETLGGLSVSFDFIGQGQPGPQPFDIIDPSTFEALVSGQTHGIQPPPTGVPAPAPLALLLPGLAAMSGTRRRTVYAR